MTSSRRGQPGCKGPTLSRGYYSVLGDAESANQKLTRDDGWMLLGDIVELDEDGYLVVVGRVDDFIIRGGKNLSAAAIEEQVAGHPDVKLVCAVAMPDPVFGERVCVFVEQKSDEPLTLAMLCESLAERGVSREMWPERLEIVETLPRNAGGKVAKQKLRDSLIEEADRAANSDSKADPTL